MNYNEVFPLALEYFQGDELAANVWVTKYALTDEKGELLEKTPADMHRRLAKEFARIEAKYPNPMSEDEIFGYLDQFKYIIPQGSPMAGIGNPYQVMSLSNCFVVEGPYDSYAGILLTDQEQAQLMKRRGGVGFDISRIRPKGMVANNAAKTTDGIGVFMDRFSNTTREVAQGGRRGALMLTISVHHPEIETFINIKNDKTRVTGANISIRLSDDFMNAVKNGEKYQQQWPVDSDSPTITQWADATEVWDKIITSAHHSAEPGLLFWDTVKRRSATDDYKQFQTVSTNPCGEITLSAYDSCRLLLVNTLSFVENPFTDEAKFDYAKFVQVSGIAQQLMDDMVDLELEQIDKTIAKIDADPEPAIVKRTERELWEKIRWTCENGRRTGLGVTAIGDAVAAMGLRYGSDESITFIEHVYSKLTVAAYATSVRLAGERGAFPVWNYQLEKDNKFINDVMAEAEATIAPNLDARWASQGRRNIACVTTAPAGSVSTLAQTTSGIEPCFMTSYTRRKKINPSDTEARVDFTDELGDQWQEFTVYHHGFQKWMEITGETDVTKSPYHKATANDIDWTAKVRAQAAAQKWIDHAISNTTNIPEDTPVEVVKDIYMTGWESGCFLKGTPVLTPDGLVNIENIEAGDYVYSHDGSIQMVTETFELPKQDRVAVQIQAYGLPDVMATADHPFLVLRSEKKNWDKIKWDDRENQALWVQADEIKDTDYLLIPRLPQRIDGIDSIKISDYLQPNEYIVEGGQIYPARMLPWKNSVIQKVPKGLPLPNEVKLTEDVLYLLGIFVAEGSYNRRSTLRINLNVKETGIADRCQLTLENVFGVSVKRFNVESNNGVSLRLEWSSSTMSRLFEVLVGRGSYNKHLPAFYTQLSFESLKALVDAHFEGDKGITKSVNLAKDLYTSRLILGQAPIWERNYGQGFDIHESPGTGQTGRVFNDFYAYRVNRVYVSPFRHEVYNIAVENTDSYNVWGIATHNCKGVTIYREGSRSGVLVNKMENALEIPTNNAPKRPIELPCEVHHMQVLGEKWLMFVGMLNGKPYELMGGLSKYVSIPKRVKTGKIVKHNGHVTIPAKYDFHYDYEENADDETVIKDINNAFENTTEAAFTRTISLALRHGAPVRYVVEQIQKGADKESEMFSFSKAASRVLKHYIENGLEVKGVCLDCGSQTLIYEEGCSKCVACGSSKCG